jgi:hypothetical protein
MPQLTVSVKGADLVKRRLQNFARDVPRIAKSTIYDAMRDALAKLRKPGKRITYPVRWDSERQRRAYFATDGFGHGIPYRRTGRYGESWKLNANEGDSGQRIGYTLSSSLGYARYVGGTASGAGQSNIHKNRWQLFRDIMDGARNKLPARVRDHLRQASVKRI